jgi:hypothetical protein
MSQRVRMPSGRGHSGDKLGVQGFIERRRGRRPPQQPHHALWAAKPARQTGGVDRYGDVLGGQGREKSLRSHRVGDTTAGRPLPEPESLDITLERRHLVAVANVGPGRVGGMPEGGEIEILRDNAEPVARAVTDQPTAR